MATRTADIHIRIEPEIKSGAETIFSELGTTASDVIASVYDYVYQNHKLPARLKLRHPKTLNLDLATPSEIRKSLDDSRALAKRGGTKTVAESYATFKERHNIQ